MALSKEIRGSDLDYSAALEISDNQVKSNILAGRANAYVNKGDLTRALADFKSALEIEPRNVNALN